MEEGELRPTQALACGIEDAGEQGGEQLDGFGGLDHGDIDEPVVHAAVGEQVDIVLDERGVAHHAADAVELVDLPVVLDGEVRDGGGGIGERREEVGDFAHVALGGLGLVHDVGVEAGARDDDETVALDAAVFRLPEQLSHVGRLGTALAAGLGQRGGFGRVADVVEEQVRGSRGEDERGDVAIADMVEHVGHGAVPAGDHDAVERAHVLRGLMRLHAVADEAQAYLIAGLGQSAREVENLV